MAHAGNSRTAVVLCHGVFGGGPRTSHHTLQTHGKLKVEDAVEIAYQVGLALDLIHSKEIAHLDVKPDNVLFRAGFGR